MNTSEENLLRTRKEAHNAAKKRYDNKRLLTQTSHHLRLPVDATDDEIIQRLETFCDGIKRRLLKNRIDGNSSGATLN